MWRDVSIQQRFINNINGTLWQLESFIIIIIIICCVAVDLVLCSEGNHITLLSRPATSPAHSFFFFFYKDTSLSLLLPLSRLRGGTIMTPPPQSTFLTFILNGETEFVMCNSWQYWEHILADRAPNTVASVELSGGWYVGLLRNVPTKQLRTRNKCLVE